MTSITREQPSGLFARFVNLVRASFGGFVRRGERQNPAAVYETAIDERTRQYRDLKEAVAGILYMRNKLEAEIHERRVEIARLYDDVKQAIRRGQDDLSVSLIEQKQVLMDELERAEREQDGVRQEAEEAKNNLVRFRDEIRNLMREKGRMLATLANAQARRRLSEALEGLSVDADMRALESVREHIARLATESTLDREIGGDDGTRRRLRAIRDEVRHEAARRELEELKQSLLPRAVSGAAAAAEAVVTGGEREAVAVG
ncbi:MAG TPA: PspA/IM30 family protein [Myxococcota bacterium]|nr:PspA/IM30 family protein [Myxococcota bacterium]